MMNRTAFLATIASLFALAPDVSPEPPPSPERVRARIGSRSGPWARRIYGLPPFFEPTLRVAHEQTPEQARAALERASARRARKAAFRMRQTEAAR